MKQEKIDANKKGHSVHNVVPTPILQVDQSINLYTFCVSSSLYSTGLGLFFF